MANVGASSKEQTSSTQDSYNPFAKFSSALIQFANGPDLSSKTPQNSLDAARLDHIDEHLKSESVVVHLQEMANLITTIHCANQRTGETQNLR
jgi:hypothetical protein